MASKKTGGHAWVDVAESFDPVPHWACSMCGVVRDYGNEGGSCPGSSRVWHAQDGRGIPVNRLDDSHLLNIDRALRDRTLRAGNREMQEAIAGEVRRRGLAALPASSRPVARFRAAASSLRAHYPKLSLGEQKEVRDSLASALRAIGLDEAADYVDSPVYEAVSE